MTRTVFPFRADDISALAKALRGQLAACGHLPGHVELLNMLARAGGYRNYQHLRASTEARGEPAEGIAAEPAVADPVDPKRVERVARLFDAEGRLTRWPGKASHRKLCLWVLWSGLAAGRTFAERKVNDRLNARHLFADHALLRRHLVDEGMVWRTPDGRAYRRIEQRPPAEALALIGRLKPPPPPPRPSGRHMARVVLDAARA